MSGAEQSSARMRLLEQVEEAARVIAPLWPLSNSIAVNPLWDLRQMPFDEAVLHARDALGISGYPSLGLVAKEYASGRIADEDIQTAIDSYFEIINLGNDNIHSEKKARPLMSYGRCNSVSRLEAMPYIDREVAKWCAAYLAGILPRKADQGFYSSWQNVVMFDPSARLIAVKAGRRRLAELGADPEDAILNCMELLGVSDEDRVWEFTQHLTSMPGWAGHAKWRSFWASADQHGIALHLVDYLAVRLCYAAVLDNSTKYSETSLASPRTVTKVGRVDGAGDGRYDSDSVKLAALSAVGLPGDLEQKLAQLSMTDIERVLLAAYEGHYRDRLLGALTNQVSKREVSPSAQVVFCIDVRSEALRRNLEACGPYETFGFAGFFALPTRFTPWWSKDALDLCPVLLRPTVHLGERPLVTSSEHATRELMGRQSLQAGIGAFDVTRKGAIAQFALAEVGGFIAGPIGIAKTLAPSLYQNVRRLVRRVLTQPVTTAIEIDSSSGDMSDDEQAVLAETALTTMGLARDFAPLVVLCGHGSSSENNPHASALDCGACGGNKGGTSARVAAAILNRQAVRNLLAERGIGIPDATFFVAAEHDTTTDKVTILDTHLVPSYCVADVERLQLAFDLAGATTAAERAAFLPGAEDSGRMARPVERAADWAQVRPEWGLARNAAFIVAPRSISVGVDLESRCFLHSYDSETDPEGVVLEAVLTAPMIVAHWISAQYYFSTVDPDELSAGDKTVHNIVAGIGVLQGAGGDLQIGLPLQSLYEGDNIYHEPMRLLVVVEAPQVLLEDVIARNCVLQELFDGQWVHLVARDNSRGNWKIRRPGGTWVSWTAAVRHCTESDIH